MAHISWTSCTFDGVKHGDGNVHGNDMQMRLCIVKLGVVSSIYGDFVEESRWRCTCAQSSLTGVYKGIFCTYAFIILKTFVRTQNLAFVRTYTFRMKSMESFIHKAPVLSSALRLLSERNIVILTFGLCFRNFLGGIEHSVAAMLKKLLTTWIVWIYIGNQFLTIIYII